MKNTIKTNQYSVFMCILSLILGITAFLGMLSASEGKNIETLETVLLNPKNSLLVDTIRISINNNTEDIVLRNLHNGYIGYHSQVTFPVNSIKVNELLRLASTTTSAQLISTNIQDLEHYGLLENAVQLQLSSSQNALHEMYSHIYFGYTDFTGTKRYVRSAQNSVIYAIDDSYFSFLQVNPSAWVDPKLFSDFLLQDYNKNDIGSIVLFYNETEIKLLNSDAIFINAIDTLLSQQSSVIIDVESSFNAEYSLSVSIHFHDGNMCSIDIFKVDESKYVVVPNSIQLLYGLEISAWTYMRILSSFTD